MAQKAYEYLWTLEEGVEDPGNGRPSLGPVYRNILAKHGWVKPNPGLDTCWGLFSHAVKQCPNNPMLGHREITDGKAGKYIWKTYQQVYDEVLHIGSAIRASGVEPNGRCGILGANCPEWMLTLQACNGQTIYCVPLYDTLGDNAVEFIIKQAEVSIAFVQETKLSVILKSLSNCSHILKTIVSFGGINDAQMQDAHSKGVKTYPWNEFVELGRRNPIQLTPPIAGDICTIMYTSGTSGEPKGVLLTNEALTTLVAGLDAQFNQVVDEESVYFSFLPLAHAFDRIVEEWFIHKGASIGYWQGNVKVLMDDVGELKPTFFAGVPRILDRIYSGIKQKQDNAGKLQKTLFDIAYKHKLSWMQKGYKQDEASPFFDMLVFSKVKQNLGGRLKVILAGAAPLAKHVEEFLSVTTCATVVQGYGLTETCAGTFIAVPDRYSMQGTIGIPMPNVDVRLESIPEMNYNALSSTPRGELCIRGKTLFTGYHKREDLTKEALTDGWLHTGDVGEWQPDGALKIIDRKKNIFKLSQGEYVAVENLENIYGLSSYVNMIWVYGNSYESVLVAVVVPNKEAIHSWAQENGEEGDFAELCERAKLKEYILSELTATGKRSKLKGFEFIKAVHLEPKSFDIERDLLTPTFKKKRQQLFKYYKGHIDSLYQSLKKQ
ncbi:hypothetical protein O6H91_10G045400 [Diphasiastrum complanatum]|uniref:Uncharacterized protein n=1 Tax=Diphasiastrum complanatum TaxID=34168 RepID=A0ACC2CGH8_DIPCM|nr:hypothetical protein O6H91_10G045400 [Diphasiastrum complanatum]